MGGGRIVGALSRGGQRAEWGVRLVVKDMNMRRGCMDMFDVRID